MEVLYWQVAVAASVAAAYLLLSRSWALGAAVAWTLWTFAALNHTPLVVIQLFVAWGTFFLVYSIKRQSREIEKFKTALSDYEQKNQERFLAAKNAGRVTPLLDSNHYSYLLKSLKTARSKILILSGWLSSSVIDGVFLSELDAALSRGVEVYLGFGYEDPKGTHEISKRAQEALSSLKDIQRCQETLFVGKFNNHQKILIVDDAYVVCGSHNWLSNRMFKNREKSFIIEDTETASSTFKQMSPLITGNPA